MPPIVSRWSDEAAAACVAECREHGEALGLRVYTSRLLGQDPALVLHGGGNTSVKTLARDVLGRDVEVLCVKGSGSDLASVGPRGLPAVRLAQLRELRQLESLSDRQMVDAVRGALLDSAAPNPSVEALLHAFLPHAFVDHTHADAILVLTDQPDPGLHVRRALGDDVLVLPWIMPGFPLAKAVAAAYEAKPGCRGIVLAKHGLFTFGADARESYERTIELVEQARRYVEREIGGCPAMLCGEPPPLDAAARQRILAEVLPVLRGACAPTVERAFGADFDRVVTVARTGDRLAAFGAHGSAGALCQSNPVTPDHVIRTKGPYLYLGAAELRDPDRIRREVLGYGVRYRRYYEDHCRARSPQHMHAPSPVVAVLAGVGLVALHRDRKAAGIAADIAERTLWVKAAAHALGSYTPLADAELAEMEYWPLELAKLGKQASPPLLGQVALVTGAAGAIGRGIAEALLEQGACVLLTDVDGERLARVAAGFAGHGSRLHAVVADLRDEAAVQELFAQCCATFGGLDCLVPNAGIARTGALELLDAATFREVLDVNTTGTMLVLKHAAPIFRKQATGGSVVVQASKNVFAPGKGFGAYSASKAAALQLMRIAALELADLGVRVNAVNADAVFGDDEVPSQLWQEVGPERMAARGLDAVQLRDYYRQRSLLKVPVTARHVGEAVAWFAARRTPTTGAVLPVDGGLPEAFPR
ncbi:MAG: bifunctional aldolase/short-chain dehydrogenase [Planctomycetes bacterium]|nr:bifunctional aldolase/short-chain dehydrogenase [Planctomycetota bacterium]